MFCYLPAKSGIGILPKWNVTCSVSLQQKGLYIPEKMKIVPLRWLLLTRKRCSWYRSLMEYHGCSASATKRRTFLLVTRNCKGDAVVYSCKESSQPVRCFPENFVSDYVFSCVYMAE